MTIVDNKFGAELITDKGKIFKFDALECMLNYIKEKQLNKDNISNTLAVNTSATVNLIETEHAIFLQSFAFPSPMGEYLSAYDTRKTAEEYQKKYPGELFSWTELLERFQVKL
jgi:copper chaperone NosL